MFKIINYEKCLPCKIIFRSEYLWGVLVLLLTIQSPSKAQKINSTTITDSTQYDNSGDTVHVDQNKKLPEVPEKDIVDVAKKVFNIKPSKKTGDEVIGRPVISVVPAVGYTLTTRLAVTLSGNCAFRISPKSKLSTIVASAAYTQNKQFTFPFQSSIWSANNKYNLLGDYRFYKYPQITFGLGSSSWIKNEDPMDYSYFRFYEVLLRQVIPNFYLGAGYIVDAHWNVSDQGTKKNLPTEYTTYGNQPRTISSGITLNSIFDSRDNSINPTKGFYTSFQYRDNMDVLGSTSSWQSLIVDIRKYYHFPFNSKNIISFWSYNWLVISGKPPFLDLPSTGWDQYSSTGLGYIQGRFRGAQMVYLETQYRFKISRNGLFGGVLFLNAQSFSAAPGTPLQAFQPGFGPGLRIKLNKVSNTNIAIDYGFGKQGSNGLFINIGESF